MLVPGVEDVETRVVLNESGGVDSMHLLVKPQTTVSEEGTGGVGVFRSNAASLSEEQEVIRSKLSTIIKNLYGFEDTAVQIEFQGG